MAAPELHSNIQAALQCITSPSPPGMIQQAQAALLQWEETRTDDYVTILMSLVGFTFDSRDENKASAAATLRLVSVLTLKAAIVRRWKDKGRAQKTLLSEGVKTSMRQSMLNLVLTGKVDCPTNQTNFITNPNDITSQQVELIQDRALQTNAASLLSKIARMDLPLKFHELIPTLVEGVKCSHGVVCHIRQQHLSQPIQHVFQTILYNTMSSLEAILSEISTQRLLVDKKYRNSIAFQYLGSIVESGLTPALQGLEQLKDLSSIEKMGGEQGYEYASMLQQYATLTSRVVSHMMISSFSKLVEESATAPLVDQVLTLIHSFLSQWLPVVLGDKNNVVNHALRKPTRELLHVHCDLIVNLQSSHPVTFVKYMSPFLDLFHSSLMHIVGVSKDRRGNYSIANAGTNINIQSSDQLYTIAFLSFLANVVGTSKYSESDAAKSQLASFFTPSLIQSLSQTLLQLFSIHISPDQSQSRRDEDDEDDNADRVQWQDDPEGFYQYEMQRSDDVGCASQNLFLALVESSFSNEVILPWLMGLLSNVASQRLAVEIEGDISVGLDSRIISSALPLGASAMDLSLQWDAIYTAAGLAGSMLESYPGFDFRSWFDASLGHCLGLLLQSESQQTIKLPILRRRMIWLLSCNAHQVTISSPLNPLGMVASALSAQNDICVRLTAVQAMDALLPQCEESPSLLHSIVEATVPALYQLTNACNEVESRSSCLELLSNLITYVGVTGGTMTNEMLNLIVTPLSTIWDNATDQNLLLKRNVLTILSCIASFVGPESCSVLYPLALPMIDDSLAKEENVFLVEEALKIWWTFLRLSKVYDQMLGKLFIRAAELSKDLEHVMILMRITEHYIILGGANFLNDHAATIQAVLGNIVGEVRPRGTAYIFLLIEALLRSFPVEGGSLLQSCGILKLFMEACASSYFEDEKCEPDRVIVLYLTALARILLPTPSALRSLLPLKLPSGADFGEEEFIELYLLKFQVAGNGAHGLLFQKLWALLLLSFYPPCQLTSCCNAVLGKSNVIFNKSIYVLKNLDANGTNLLSYDVGYDEEEETIDVGAAETLEQRRKDIGVLTPLSATIIHKMNGLPNQLGQKYQDFLGTIENDTLQQLEEALKSNQG